MADFGEDIAVSLVPDFTRFDQEYRAQIERLQRNAISIPVKFDIDKAKLKADLEAAARELSRTTEIKVQVKLDTTLARAELARLRADASMRAGGVAGGAGGGGGIGMMPLLIGGGAVAGAAFAPGLVGLGLGAGGALGAGVLGYQGLKAQAGAGTGFGTQIYDEINKIKASFKDLGQTAADALGPGLASALEKIRAVLPDLAPDMDKLGSALGNVGDSLATGLVNVLQNSGPLIDSFSQGIEKLAGDFAHWTGGDQFRHFMQEAGQQIPHLINGLEGLAGVLGDVYKILHPLEPLLITAASAMGKFADAVAKLPQPVQMALLAAVVGGALGGRGGRGGGGLGFVGGPVGRGLIGGGLAYGGLQQGGGGGVLSTTIGGGLLGSSFGPVGGLFGAAAGLGAGGGLAIGRALFGSSGGAVAGHGNVVGPGNAGPFGSLIQAAVNAARAPSAVQGIYPYYQLGQAGISPLSPEGGALRTALTTPLLGGTKAGAAALAPGISALESRYGPAIQAMQQYRQAQAQVQQAVQQENQVEIAGAASVSAAQASLQQARQAAAQSAIQDAQAIKNAEQAVADARRNAARVAQQNADAISAAEQQVTQAQQNAADAQKNLTQARADAARQLQDMARAAIDTGDSLQSAQLRLQQLQLNQAARTGTKTPEEIYREQNQLINQGNALELRSAQHQVTDAQLAHTRAVDDNNKAQKKGVEGMPQVVAAKRAVRDANNAVADSEKNLARVRQQAADAEIAASEQVGRAVQTLENTRRQAALDRIQNEQNVANAVTGVATAEDNAKQANDDAHQRTVAASDAAKQAGDNFKYQAAQVGETTSQIQSLAREIAQGKFDLTATFTDKNGLQVRRDTIDVQRDLYEAVLIAGGKTPAEARRLAAKQLPYPAQPVPGPAPPGPTGGRKIMATGGPVFGPGGPTDDLAGLFALSAGEHVWTAKEVAKAGGHDAVKKMRAFFAGLADGGSPWDAQLMVDYKKMGLLALLRAWAHDHPAGPGPGAPPSGGPYTGSRNWAGAVRSVLGELHSPSSFDAVMARIDFESGGNPTIVNTTDSNWLAGHPSVGLLQVINSTFRAYAGPYRRTGPFSYGVSVNPHANIYAGVNYADSTYGGMPDPRITHKGYDAGGVLPPGMTVAVNASTKPEAVLSHAQWRLLRQLASGRRGPVMHVENQIIQTPAVADAMVRMLQFASLAGGGGL